MTMKAKIPIPPDTAKLIDETASAVQNRSLLLDKFVFHKEWPPSEQKWDEASKWSLFRIAKDAKDLLQKEANDKERKANGRKVSPENQKKLRQQAKQEKLRQQAELAHALAAVSWDQPELAALRIQHSQRFVSLFVAAFKNKSRILSAKLEGRLAINLSDGLIKNAGICLDRLFGMPYLPGSAVKGVCRAAAYEELCNAKVESPEKFKFFRRIFGTSDTDFSKGGELAAFEHFLDKKESRNLKGAISFLPAYPIGDTQIVVDLTNVHYPEYYRTGKIEELKNENPRPNPFPCVETGATFAFCLVLNGIDEDRALLDQAAEWLKQAITARGLGAKTASGYGWFSIISDNADSILAGMAHSSSAVSTPKTHADYASAQPQTPPPQKPHTDTEMLLALNDEKFANFAKELDSKPESQQIEFIKLLRKEKRERWKGWKKNKPELAKKIQELCAKLKQEPLP